MRFRTRPVGPGALIVGGLAATLAGCSSTGTQSSLTTSSLAPRPQERVYTNQQRTYPDGSTYGQAYTVAPQRQAYPPRQYVDPGTPTPRNTADANYRPYGQANIQTASIGASGHGSQPSYDPNARWQQPSRIVTGSAGPAARPQQAPVVPQQQGPHVIQVREGDTLYSISRTHRVPLHDIVVANRLTSDRIEVGQRIVIPTRIR